MQNMANKANMAQPIFCEVCNIGISSEVTMREHVKGRRHLQTLTAIERRKAMARNSLYCHGFPPHCHIKELKEYFQRFGQVNRIMVETQKGCYCIVHYETDEPVQMALNQSIHLLQGYTLTVRPRKPITTQRQPSDSDSKARKNKVTKDNEDNQEGISHSQLMNNLLKADSVLAQMEMLYETLRLTEVDLDWRKNVCEYLHNILIPFFPTCTIHQFGSSVNGFGMQGCDMDIFLDLHDTDVSLHWEATLRNKVKPVSLPYIRELQLLKVTEGPLLPSQLRKLSLVHRIKLLSRILQQHAPQCADVIFVPSTRCPIVRFVHLPTGIKCDLSINNRLALRNTQLLRMYGDDPRVRLLVFAVRYWGKIKMVAGNTNCGPRMTNYCLSVLVLFFLANKTKPPVLFSPEILSHLATEPRHFAFIENWNCSMPDVCPPSNNKQTADELLREFFTFFNTLPLSTSVILTRTNRILALNDFLVDNASKSYIQDFKVRAMAVQDPFVLHHNIAQNVSNVIRDLFLQEVGYAAIKTTRWTLEDTAPPSDQPSQSSDTHHPPLWGLAYLFSTVDCVPSAVQKVTLSSSWCELSTKASKDKKWQFSSSQWTFPLILDLANTKRDVLHTLHSKGDLRVVWFRRVRTLLVWTLREVFLYTVMDKDGTVLEEGQDLDMLDTVGGEGEDSEDEHVYLEDGGKVNMQSSRESATEATREVSCAVVEDQSMSNPNTSQTNSAQVAEKSPQMCSVDNQCSTEQPEQSSGSQPSSSEAEEIPDVEKPRAEYSESVIMEPSPSDGGSGAEVMEDKEEAGLVDCATVSDIGDGREGRGMQSSPSSEQDYFMHSPSQASPMSELSHPSPYTYEGKGLPTDCTVAISPRSQPFHSQASSSTQLSLSQDVPQASSGCSDVEMVADAVAAASTPAVNCMDSSTVCSSSKDNPGTLLAGGKAASGKSFQPLKMDFSPREGTLSVNDKGGKAGCSSWKTETQNTSVSKCSAEGKVRCPTPPKAGSSQTHSQQKCRPFRVYCEGRQRAWYGRKIIRTILLDEGYTDDLELEQHISKRIAERDANTETPYLKFHCTLCPIPKGNYPVAEVSFEPTQTLPKEFSVFPTFFKSYFTKLVTRQLLESPSV